VTNLGCSGFESPLQLSSLANHAGFAARRLMGFSLLRAEERNLPSTRGRARTRCPIRSTSATITIAA
jgi:hypothetical protein